MEFSNDIAPGLVALGGPAVTGNTVVGPNGQFIPITRSKLVLQRDFSQIGSLQRASFAELFFVTLVHEFGHTLELIRDTDTGEPKRIVVPQGHYRATRYAIEPDASNAKYFMAAAAMTKR